MDLSTRYCGLQLACPLIPGAGPFGEDLDQLRRLEDAGAAAVVLPSLFEEQIPSRWRRIKDQLSTAPTEQAIAACRLGPDEYLDHVAKARQALGIPVFASLNGASSEGWIDYARLIEQAGASALELNIYFLAAEPEETGEQVEWRTIEIARSVRAGVTIPLAVKLSPYYSSVSALATAIDGVGVDALVLFNRFYQPDIDLDSNLVAPQISLSTPAELPLRLRWLALLHGRIEASLAVTGGVHSAQDALKAILMGASAVQLVSSILKAGPQHLTHIQTELARLLEQRQVDRLQSAVGQLSLLQTRDPAAYERANYIRVLREFSATRPPAPAPDPSTPL